MDLFSRRCMWVNGPIVVGAGPSGLAVAAQLKDRGVPYVMLERSDCIASLWQKKTYDRLKLHLPKKFCQLPGLPFPDSYPEYPCKKQFIDYLESYTKHFDIRPKFNQSVQSSKYDETSGLWRVKTVGASNEEVEYIGKWLVVATGENAESVMPEINGMSSFGSQITHVSEYKSGEIYEGKNVLVVGCGNSGMEVCLDLCDSGAMPSMVVRDSVHVLPREVCRKSTFEIACFLMRWLPLWFVDKIMLLLSWFILGNIQNYGLKRPTVGPLELKNTQGRTPVLDYGALSKIKLGEIEIVPGVKRFLLGSVEFLDGRVLQYDAVIMATGYRSNVPYWLHETGFFSENGLPKSEFPNSWKGKSGLYAVGFTKRGLAGASCDAVKVAKALGEAWKEETRQAKKLVSSHRRCISQIY